jgi:Tfp pilus assembly protein PilO
MTTPRVIKRKSITVNLRGQDYEIYSLSIAGLEKLKNSINMLVTNFIKKASILTRFTSENASRRRWFGLVKPQLTSFTELLDTSIKEVLNLLETTSGLPHELFDPKNPEDCLTLEEISELAEVVFEVNGLGFIMTALKNQLIQIKEEFQNLRSSAPSASGMDILQ